MLDSSTLIRVLRRRRHEVITQKLASLKRGDAVISSIVRHELMFGALRDREPEFAQRQLTEFLADFPCLPLDGPSADVAARLRADLAAVGKPIGPYDLLIAAIAMANGLTVVTCNSGEFRRVPGLEVQDWETNQ